MGDDTQAADVTMPQGAIPDVGQAPTQAPTLSASSPQEQDANGGFADKAPQSRLASILGAVARTATVGLSGIPDTGRPSFVTGLGSGARAGLASNANEQAIKFKSFDDQVRLAELNHQDQKMQLDTQAQQDAHTKAELDNRAFANENGIDYDTIANHGTAVMDHLTAQTAANGAASVPPGTHVSADGDNIYMPKNPDSQKTRDGQKSMYTALAPALGLPSLPPGASFVPPKLMNMLTNKTNGFGLDGKPISHDELPGLLGATQTQRDTMAKNGASDAQLKTLDNMIGIYKANLDSLDKHAAGVKQQTKAAELAAETSPEAIAGAAKKKAAEEAATLPFAKAKAQMEQAVKDGDPNAAGQMLANGDIAPSQIISTRNPAFAQQAFDAAKKADPTYNAQRAESEYKVASSPTNVGFFGSAKSLTDPKGTLDQLEAAYKKLPNGQIPKFNSLEDWKSASKGEGATAGFAQTALGVADDYAKVMGGGQGSDSAREEMLKGFAMASSPKQMEASIEAARMAIASQMNSRIGSNKALGRMYGENMPQPTKFASAPGKPRMQSRDGGKSWQPALAQ